MPSGPLEGVRVLELGQLIAGPMAGRMLADFGAEVIKVEPPGSGDPMREWGLNRFQGHGLWWPLQSRNKMLITLDLRQDRGRELLLQLAGRSSVLIENFRPGTIERWGLGPQELHEANPGLIIARVSGYGQTGPYAQRAGFASVGEAMGGLRYVNGYPGQVPPRPGVSLGDSLAAMFAVQGILLALYHRDVHGGRGQVVDASILESCFSMLDSTVPEYGKLGVVREPQGSRIGSAVPSNVYTSRDGKYLAVAANADNIFRRLCTAVGRPELADDDRFATHWARFEHVDELDSIVGAWVGERDAAEADRILNEAGVVCGPVYSIADIFEDPHYRAREMLVTMRDEVLGEVVVPGVVPKLSETPGELRHAGSWELGRDNRAVYADLLGLEENQLAELAAEGVI
jgi:crotonobetainyl-CoA:carnitine CoA-transferase CaiB-like acyl-CoA transferase